MRTYHPLKELLLARLREFVREPAAVFWVYGFPVLLAVGLGIAFRNRPAEQVFVDVQEHDDAARVVQALRKRPSFVVSMHPAGECRERLRLGKSSIVVLPGDSYTFLFDPTRPESILARKEVDDVLQREAGRQDPVSTRDEPVEEPGARYIDFLVPGLLGMNLMGGGLWGVGFVIVDMRVRKLLKRLVATPMRKEDFLLSILLGRLVFVLPEMVLLLLVGRLGFHVPIEGNLLTLTLTIFVGAMAFSGVGL